LNYDQWILDFLNAIGAQPTPQNIAFMNAWISKESGSYPISDGWNPLNTTQTAPGSYGGGAQGNIQFFPSYQSGLDANVATIQNGLYGDLLNALRGGAPSTSVPYAGLNTWGTGSLAGMGGSTPTSSTLSPYEQGLLGSRKAGTSTGGSSSSTPAWLQNIQSIPILGKGAGDLVSIGVVGAFAITFFLIGGVWLVLGNQTTRQMAINVGKTASKAAETAAA
jgi:hypothetical protein